MGVIDIDTDDPTGLVDTKDEGENRVTDRHDPKRSELMNLNQGKKERRCPVKHHLVKKQVIGQGMAASLVRHAKGVQNFLAMYFHTISMKSPAIAHSRAFRQPNDVFRTSVHASRRR
jgi:predicted GNAT family acetyltransferase